MCIRDRSKVDGTKTATDEIDKAVDIVNNIADGVSPVSYTHLSVLLLLTMRQTLRRAIMLHIKYLLLVLRL